jgi:hypothetical protein
VDAGSAWHRRLGHWQGVPPGESCCCSVVGTVVAKVPLPLGLRATAGCPSNVLPCHTAPCPPRLPSCPPLQEFDGASKRNPGPGGFGAVLFDDATGVEVGGWASARSGCWLPEPQRWAKQQAGLHSRDMQLPVREPAPTRPAFTSSPACLPACLPACRWLACVSTWAIM